MFLFLIVRYCYVTQGLSFENENCVSNKKSSFFSWYSFRSKISHLFSQINHHLLVASPQVCNFAEVLFAQKYFLPNKTLFRLKLKSHIMK